MVRSGEYSDVQAIVDMASEFWSHTIFDVEPDDESIECMAKHCIDSDLMSVLVINDKIEGFACGIAGPLLGNNKVLTGTEVAWWVNEDHRGGKNGIALLRHLEGLAKDKGILYWSMAYMESSMPETIKGIYEKMGYKQSEVSYTRVL